MDRRKFVVMLGLGVSGCLSDSSSTDAGTGTTHHEPTTKRRPTTAAAESTTAESTTDGTNTAATATETAARPTLHAAPGDCPDYGDDVVRVVCDDEAPDDAPMVMKPSRAALDLPGKMTFTLENDTDTRFNTNFYSARLHKRVDGEWFLVAPQGWPSPLTPLAASESQTWTVSLSGEVQAPAGSDSESDADALDTSQRNIGGLGGGRYAFGIAGWFEGGSYKRQTAFAATIDVRGDPVELAPTDAVENVTIDGEVLTARWTGGSATGEYAREARYVLERTNKSPDIRLITEQILQPNMIGPATLPRDALALATEHGVREVRLTGQTASSPPFGVDYRIIEYDGTAYEVSASETGTETET